MRGIIIITGSGILISAFTLIYSVFVADSGWIMKVICLILVLMWIALLLVICHKGRQWKRDSAMLEEITKQELQKQERETDSQIRNMKEDVAWLKRQIAHGVRMPLAIISGYGDLLRKQDYDSLEEQKMYISKICSNIDYLNQTFQIIIDDEAGKEEEQNVRLDLLEVARNIVDYADNLTKSHGVKLELNSSHEHVYIRGNRIDIMKVLYNLIENSLKYMRHGDAIYITIEQVENQAWVVYRDNGEGVTKQDAERLTELNYRGEQNEQETDAVKGTGMGMYLVKDIIQKHHGTLQVKGGVGTGFAMYIIFPLADEA